jgi:hypothetical protein
MARFEAAAAITGALMRKFTVTKKRFVPGVARPKALGTQTRGTASVVDATLTITKIDPNREISQTPVALSPRTTMNRGVKPC